MKTFDEFKHDYRRLRIPLDEDCNERIYRVAIPKNSFLDNVEYVLSNYFVSLFAFSEWKADTEYYSAIFMDIRLYREE